MRVPSALLPAFLAAMLTNAFAPPARGQAAPPAAELAEALRKGGLVLYMRHPATEARTDAEEMDFTDCATQRNLSDAGRQVAAEVGAALRAVRARVGRAVTSEYCRARETARLMGVAGAEVDAALNDGGRMLAKGPSSPQAEALRAMLRARPAPGEVALIVAHRPNIVDAAGAGFADLGEAEIVVFRAVPDGAGFAPLARIRAPDWPALVAASGG